MAEAGFKPIHLFMFLECWMTDNKYSYGKEFPHFLVHFRQIFGKEADYDLVQTSSKSSLP